MLQGSRSGSSVSVLGVRVQGLGFRVTGLGFRDILNQSMAGGSILRQGFRG